jgi:hypothetical protein
LEAQLGEIIAPDGIRKPGRIWSVQREGPDATEQ